MNKIGHFLVYLLVRILICVVQAMPIAMCHRLCRILAILFNDVLRVRRQVVDENLRHAFPDWPAQKRRRLAKRMWEHLFLITVEVAHAPRKIHWTNWRDYLRPKDDDILIRAIFDDRPVVLVSGHFGNFEMGSYMLGLLGFHTTTVARTLDNPFLDSFVNWFRSGHGSRILPKQGSAEQIAKLLDHGGALVLLGDQHAGPKGCWVDFFGRPVSIHKSLAVLSLANDAPMIITSARRLARPLEFELAIDAIADPRKEADHVQGVRELTQWYTDKLEEIIRRQPDQYWWVHRLWKGQPKKRRRKKAAPVLRSPDNVSKVA